MIFWNYQVFDALRLASNTDASGISMVHILF